MKTSYSSILSGSARRLLSLLEQHPPAAKAATSLPPSLKLRRTGKGGNLSPLQGSGHFRESGFRLSKMVEGCRFVFLTILLAFVSAPTFLRADDAIQVENFSPQGAVTTVRQVRVQFSTAVAPFGDLKGAPNPMQPNCTGEAVPAAAGRWVDQQNWVYEFDADLPTGVKCSFGVTSEFRASHAALTGATDFNFTTTPAKASERPDPCKPGGPLMTLQSPSGSGEDDEGGYGTPASINEAQLFVVQSNCPVDSKSIIKSVWFEVDGLKDRVGVQVIEGVEREGALATRGMAGRENLTVIKPRLSFPSGAEVSLVWGQGVRSLSGFTRNDEQRVVYHVRSQFEVSTRCSHTFTDGSCDPYLPIYAIFTEAVPNWAHGEYQFPDPITLTAADGRSWSGKKSFFREDDVEYNAVEFTPPFSPNEELSLNVSEKLEDATGRLLQNRSQFPIKVKVGKVPPMVRFGAVFGIVEKGNALPITLRNVDAEFTVNSGSNVDLIHGVGDLNAAITSTSNTADVLKWLVAVQNRYEKIEDNTTSLFGSTGIPVAVDTFTVKKPNGPEAFEVVGIPFKKPGFYVLEVASPSMGADLKGSGKTMYVPTTALVTNMAVHVKLGKESSIAWVTTLDTGSVVEGAEVSVRDCSGSELFHGRTDSSGITRIPALKDWDSVRCGLEQKYVDAPGVATAPVSDGSLIVSATKGDDFTFVLSSWDDGIENWRFNLPQEYYSAAPNVTQTVFDRTLFRRGETVHMKHLVRTKSTRGFDPVPAEARPTGAEIWHIGSGDKYEIPLEWKANGSAENTWEIPADAKLGDYNVYFIRPDGSTDYRYTGAFSVLDYRVPLMRAVIVPPKDEVITPPQVPIDISVHYLAGGGASSLPIKVRYQVQPSSFSFGGIFEDFSFAEEIPLTTPTNSEEGIDEGDGYREVQAAQNVNRIRTVSSNLDATGSVHLVLDNVPKVTRPSKLMAEVEFKDPNGEIQTVSSTVPLLPNPYLVGLKTDSWAQAKSGFKFSVAVVNSRGDGLGGIPVSVQLYQRDTYTHRKRVIGGSFIYENQIEDTDRGAVCEGITAPDGILVCTSKLQLSGSFILEARAKDPIGRVSATASSVFVGEDDFWFAQENTDRMDLLPERKEYQPGETARFQVRIPFKKSTALVSLEREGIVDAFVTEIDRNNPIVEIPVKPNYGPNVFVSVMAVRGRIAEAPATALFDPGKPAFRLGMSQIRVGWKGYTLKVGVKTEREVFKVREQVPVHFTVRTPDGEPPPFGTELVVAAVDEGLLELKKNESWKLLEAMMSPRSLAVRTMTAQMFVIGKRHFGLKALPFGGGGGKSTTRELFDTLLYWNPALAVDVNGEASATIPLNDSITSFKIVGVAIGGSGQFGTGSTSIRANKDFMLFGGLPPLVRNGDLFTAEVTARNTTDQPAKVSVALKVTGEGIAQPESKDLDLAAGESKVVTWPVKAPVQGEKLQYLASVTKAGQIEDSLKISQVVAPAVPVEVVQATLSQLKGPQKVPVALPKDALPGRGGIRVTFASSLGENIEAVRDYMRAYPYGCLEQRTSKAVALDDGDAWERIAQDLPTYLDRNGFAKYFPSEENGSELLTAYVLGISDEAGFEIPDSPKQKMVEALKGFVAGKIRTQSFRFLDEYYAELGYKLKQMSASELDLLTRKIGALEALSRYGEADLGLTSGLWPDPNILPTSAVVNLLAIASRTSGLSDRAKRLKELEQVLRSRLDLAGTSMRFSGEVQEGFFWAMVSSDVTIVRFVSTVLADDELFKHFQKDMGRLIRGMLDRLRHGRWDLTVANAWGSLAIEKQKERLSPIPVGGKSFAEMPSKNFEYEWGNDTSESSAILPWPEGKSELTLSHEGTGAPWVTLQSLAAVPRTEPIKAGYIVNKKIEVVQQKVPGEYHVGDVLRVKIPFNAQSAKTWVVVEDPVPAGVTILGGGLDRDSALLTQGGSQNFSWVYPAFEERTFGAYRAYFSEVPKGDFSVEYVMRFNTAGEFVLPTTRIEAMYAPEMFGELPNAKVTVLP